MLWCLNEVEASAGTDVGGGKEQRERRNTGESFEWCAASSSSWWWMRHRWKRKMSYPASGCSPHQSWSSLRRPRPPVRSTKIDRGLCCRVSTPLPPMSTNAPLPAWHNVLKQDSLYFLTQILPWLCFPNQLLYCRPCLVDIVLLCVMESRPLADFLSPPKMGWTCLAWINIFTQTHVGSSGRTDARPKRTFVCWLCVYTVFSQKLRVSSLNSKV